MRHSYFFSFFLFLFVSCSNTSDREQAGQPAAPGSQPMTFEEKEREEMMKAASAPRENPYKDAVIEVKPFKDSLGWGYDIFINKSQYVHQPHIPAVPGNRGFISEALAKKAGEFVAYKIRNNIMPPSVTPQELDSLGVLK
jgi:hypothetical protein